MYVYIYVHVCIHVYNAYMQINPIRDGCFGAGLGFRVQGLGVEV